MFSIKGESKKLIISIIIILALFLIVCIATSLYYGDELLLGSLEKFDDDDVRYLRSADTLIKTGKLTYRYPDTSTVFIMPGLVLILVPFVKIFGIAGAILPFRIFSAILQTITLYLIFLIARKMISSKTAIVALLLTAIYIPNIYMTTLVLTETIFLFLFMILCLIVLYGIETKKTKYYVVGGIVWGISALFRPSIALFPLVILGIWIKKKYTLQEMVKFGLAASIAFVCVMSPWWIRNAVVFNRFIPFTLSTGNPMLQGMFWGDQIDNEIIEIVNYDNLQYVGNEILDNEIETKLARRVFVYTIKNEPTKYIMWHTVGKIVINFYQGYIMKPLYGLRYIYLIFQHEIYLCMAIIALMIGVLKKYKEQYQWLAIFSIIYFILVHLPFLPYPRYMYPIEPFIIILAGSLAEVLSKKH